MMRRLALVLLAIFLTADGLTAVQPRASASGDSAPASVSVPARA